MLTVALLPTAQPGVTKPREFSVVHIFNVCGQRFAFFPGFTMIIVDNFAKSTPYLAACSHNPLKLIPV
jgi:hypothetical protein